MSAADTAVRIANGMVLYAQVKDDWQRQENVWTQMQRLREQYEAEVEAEKPQEIPGQLELDTE